MQAFWKEEAFTPPYKFCKWMLGIRTFPFAVDAAGRGNHINRSLVSPCIQNILNILTEPPSIKYSFYPFLSTENAMMLGKVTQRGVLVDLFRKWFRSTTKWFIAGLVLISLGFSVVGSDSKQLGA